MNGETKRPVLEPPTAWLKGLVPTMNDTGFMFEVLDDFALDFAAYSGNCGGEVLELGAAYGVATLAALEAGATIRACDIDPRHLEILRSRVPDRLSNQLSTEIQHLPDAKLPEQHFAAILCSRVFHFLTGDDIDASLCNMYRWLKPGGRVYLIADTPYGIWRKFIPTWDANHESDERWPGQMDAPLNYLPYIPRGDSVGPPFMNLLSPALLSRACEEAGFTVIRAEYISREDFSGSGKMDGRENCGVVALKPE